MLLLVFLLPGGLLANLLTAEEVPAALEHVRGPVAPHLADIIPLETELSLRFEKMKNDLKGPLDVADIEKAYAGVTADLGDVSTHLKQLPQYQGSNEQKRIKIATLKRVVENKKNLLKSFIKPLKGEIKRFDSWHKEWQSEKEHWDNWRSSLLKGWDIEQLRLTFVRAEKTIDTALLLIRQHLEVTLKLQSEGAATLGRLDRLDLNLNHQSSGVQKGDLFNQSPPIFSASYFSQYSSELWTTILAGLKLLKKSNSFFFAPHAWTLLLQMLLFLVVLSILYRYRAILRESKRWKILSEAPLSTGFFIVILIFALFLSYLPDRDTLGVIYLIFGGIACVRILGKVIDNSWKTQAIYGVMLVFCINTIFVAINLPQPLFRLYTFLVSCLALYFFSCWYRECSSRKETEGYFWLLRGAFVCTVVILLAEIFGRVGLSYYLFVSIVQSTALTFPYLLLMYMVYGGLHWVFFSSPVWKIKLLRNDAESLVQSVGFLFIAAICGFALLPTFLMSWGVYDSMLSAMTSLLSLGFFIETQWVSVGTIIASMFAFYSALLVARILPKVILDEAITGQKIQRGVQNSIGKLIRYTIIFIGLLLAFMALGFDFTKLTIIMGALGVGIGFGLQGIVNNFVSGLILLFERPLREGDTIELGDKTAQIKKIGLRATIVETFDHADVIIPNADLINNQVTNWTLSNRQVRLSVPVGVAYGSNVSQVVEILLVCAKAHQEVEKSPTPHVLFINFGESSLDFELRVWLAEADMRLGVKSDLYHAIEQAFRESNVEIPFPQMDLHLRETEGATNTVSSEPTS
ncbi:MAG: mechanosensitive ion channel [Desulfuromusa sp.]|nr:mechanosensitive ion channel [Desulfuromusa sp.]